MKITLDREGIRRCVVVALEGRLCPAATDKEIERLTTIFFKNPNVNASKVFNTFLNRKDVLPRSEAAKKKHEDAAERRRQYRMLPWWKKLYIKFTNEIP